VNKKVKSSFLVIDSYSPIFINKEGIVIKKPYITETYYVFCRTLNKYVVSAGEIAVVFKDKQAYIVLGKFFTKEALKSLIGLLVKAEITAGKAFLPGKVTKKRKDSLVAFNNNIEKILGVKCIEN